MLNRKPTLSLLAIVAVGVLAAVIIHRVTFASPSPDDFFRLRDFVYAVLHERLSKPMEGVRIVLPPTDESLEKLARPFPGNEHIERVIRDTAWHGGGSFQILLELDDSILPVGKQGNSETMTATVLLNHYFSDVEKLGLRRVGSPGVVMGKVQSAWNVWFVDPERTISVEGTVFVSPESKQAIVMGVVHEQFSR